MGSAMFLQTRNSINLVRHTEMCRRTAFIGTKGLAQEVSGPVRMGVPQNRCRPVSGGPRFA